MENNIYVIPIASIQHLLFPEEFLFADRLFRNVLFFIGLASLMVTLSRFRVAESILLST